jgi:cell division protein ZapA (FtsZ GTPase activity inhibitor)
LKGFCRILGKRKYMKKATRSLERHFKNLKKENQKLNSVCRLLRRKKHMKKATKSLKSYFKNFKKKTKIERFLSVIPKKET